MNQPGMSAQRVAQLLTNPQNNLADSIPNHSIIGTNPTPAPFSFEPSLVLDDLLYHRQLAEQNWIAGFHPVGSTSENISLDRTPLFPFPRAVGVMSPRGMTRFTVKSSSGSPMLN
jgi:hypothetical protein